MSTGDRCRQLTAALKRAEAASRIHAEVMQHDAITATFGHELRGLPRLRWSRPAGTGAAGVRGRAIDGDRWHRIAMVATYAASPAGGLPLDVVLGLAEALVQTSVILAGVPVTVETVIWTHGLGRRRIRQDAAEDIVVRALTADSPVRVRCWDGVSFRLA